MIVPSYRELTLTQIYIDFNTSFLLFRLFTWQMTLDGKSLRRISMQSLNKVIHPQAIWAKKFPGYSSSTMSSHYN